MRPTIFPEVNRTLTPPEGMPDCEPLPTHAADDFIISRWQPTEEERRLIAAGHPVWLWVFGSGGTHPPVSLEVCPTPFVNSPRRN